MKKKISKITFVFLIIILSTLLSMIPYSTKSTIINIEFLTTSSFTLFGASLTILALLFTIIDRYKENCEKNLRNDILMSSLPVLKNIGEDVIGFLVILILLFLLDILSIPIEQFQSVIKSINLFSNFDIARFVLIMFTVILLCITADITIVVVTLINGLFKINHTNRNESFDISLKEREFLTLIRKLHPKYRDELSDYLKTLYTKQQIENQHKE